MDRLTLTAGWLWGFLIGGTLSLILSLSYDAHFGCAWVVLETMTIGLLSAQCEFARDSQMTALRLCKQRF